MGTSAASGQALITWTGPLDPGTPPPPYSNWSVTGITPLTVGYGGAATLTVAGGATVTSNGATIGFGGSSNSSTATITGASSSWMAGHMTIIGWGSSGRLIVEDGGFFKSNNINVGYGGGAAALIVRDGGRVEGSGLYLDASYAVGPVTVTVTGAGSTLTVLQTKFFEGGLLTVENGGRVQSGQMELRGGSIIVTGAGSTLDVSGADIELGLSGRSGTLTIEAGGEVKLISLMMGSDPASSATLNLLGDAVNGRGVLEAYRVVNQGGTVTLNLNGGILRAAVANNANFLVGFPALTIGANGAFFDSNGFSIGVSTSFDGTGGLTKQGAGTLTLTGTNTYTGATTIEAGTLLIDAARAMSAASDYRIATGAQLQISDGLGAVVAGSLAGAGSIQIGTGTTLTAGANNSSTTFSGKITGTGEVTKTGTGTLTLTGANTYTGSTTVSAGKLVVNGSLASSVTLDGGTLGGSGTIGGVSVGNGGTVAPGNSIGTLRVSGNVSFASGSTYQVEVNAAGQSDLITATGTASITGGTVQVLAENGNYAAATSYTILAANGGVTGQFSTVTSNLAFLTPSLSYGGTSVTLTMTRNDTGFGPGTTGSTSGTYVAATRNQGFIANAAERLGVGNPVYDTLLSGTTAEARAGFDLLSGEAHAQAVSVMIEESRLVRDTILGRLRGPLLTQAGQQVAASFSADLPGRKGAITMPAPVPQPRYAFWGEAFGGTGNTNADGNAAGQSRRTGGALLGADVMVYDAPGSSLKVGVAGGYSQSRFDLDARLSSGKLESGHAALYAGARFGSLRFDAGAAYTWSESDIRRQVQIRGFGDLLRLQRPGQVMQGFAELGYGFAFSGFALEPFAQLALIRVSTDAGTERGGAAALRVLSSEQTLGFTTLGVRAEAQIGTMPLFARAMLGWRHGFGELTPQAKTAFAAGTTPSVVFAASIDREALVAEAGLDWRISSSTALGLTYSAAIGERSRDHALKGRVEMRF